MTAIHFAPRASKHKTLNLMLSLVAAAVMVGAMLAEPAIGGVALLLAIIPAAATIYFCLAFFNTLDEVAKQAHYVAWFWGGVIGMGAIPVVILVVYGLDLARNDWLQTLMLNIWGMASSYNAFALGVMAGLLPLMLGYLVWWAAFWLRRR